MPVKAEAPNRVPSERYSQVFLEASNLTYVQQLPQITRVTQGKVSEAVKEEILSMVAQAGFDPQIAIKIITCESGWQTQAKHLNTNGTWDRGIWQINDIHGLSLEDRYDPIKSTLYAIELMKSKRGYNHWTCYTK